VRADDGVVALNSVIELMRDLRRPRADLWEVAVWEDALASDGRAAAVYHAEGRRNGRTLDLDQVLLFRIEDGLVREVLALPSDPGAFEAFWA